MRPQPRRIHLTLLAVLCLALAACDRSPGGSAPQDGIADAGLESPAPVQSAEAVEPPNSPQPQATPQEIPEVLGFTAPTLGGGQLTGAELAGRDVAIWFWAPW